MDHAEDADMAGRDDRASAERLKGSVKEAIGKLTGDARTESEGRRQKRGGAPRDAGGKRG